MQKLILSWTIVFILGFVSCQPYEDTYSKTQKEIDAMIAEEKIVFDKYVDSTVFSNVHYKLSDTIETNKENGFVFLKVKLGNGKAIQAGDQVGISYKYRELRRNDTTQIIEEFKPKMVYVLPDSAYVEESESNNVNDNDPYMVSATTSLYTTKTSPSRVSTVLGHCVERLKEGDSATVIMSYVSHGLNIANYRSIVLDLKVTYIQKQ